MGLVLIWIGIIAAFITGPILAICCYASSEKGFKWFMTKIPSDKDLENVPEDILYMALKKVRTFLFICFIISACILMIGIMLMSNTSNRLR